MFGLKNLVPRGTLCDDNYTLLKKKSDQYQRNIGYFSGHIHKMVQTYMNYYEFAESILNEAAHQMQTGKEVNQQFYSDMVRLFCSINAEIRKFVEKAELNEKSLSDLINVFSEDYKQLIEAFKSKSRDYLDAQQNVMSTCKKYFTSYKEMLDKIEAYKNTFMDVKLIYNNEEKLKLYSDCAQHFKKMTEVAHLIQIKVDNLNILKIELADAYHLLRKQLENFTISFASRYVQELRKFNELLFKLEKNNLQVFAEKVSLLEFSAFPTFFETQFNLQFQELIGVEINAVECRVIPSLVVYSGSLKQEGLFRYKRCLVIYYSEMSKRSERRRRLTRKMMNYIKQYIKGMQTELSDLIKDVIHSFEKMRRKIGETFGSRWISFYKIVASIFENYLQNVGRLGLRVSSVFFRIQNYVAEESNMMGDFLKELKDFIDRNVHKKIIKNFLYCKQDSEQEIMSEEKTVTEQQVSRSAQFLKTIFNKYGSESEKIYKQGKKVYQELLFEIKLSMSEYFAFFNEINKTYYHQEQYAKSYQAFQDEMSQSVKEGMDFFDNIELSILKQRTKITFDSEFNKIQGFKKFKKPKELEEIEGGRNTLPVNMRASIEQQLVPGNRETKTSEGANQVGDNIANILNRDIFLGENGSKNAEFLLRKITIETNQKYIRSYSCSLHDSVILAGRLFLTSNRLCFYSKFNSKNIFFGQTFIQVPKSDIKKIEKRSMSAISDHAIEITTINGCLIFRSLLARDQAYAIIKKTFQINNEQIFFEEEEENQEENMFEQQIEYEDDMKEESGKERESKLLKELQEFNYVDCGTTQFSFPGLTVVKFLKMFELDQEVTINRANFPSFLYYYKDLCEHKDINIEPWDPNPFDYLNVINIKEDAPQSFSRSIAAVIPLPPSSIPFMPKVSLTTQNQTMHLINKDLVVIESVVKNSGVPYCQTFDVRLKRVLETVEEHKIKQSAFAYLNFNQSVMVKSTIESKTIESIKESNQKQNDEVKSYLRTLQKKMMKAGHKESPEDKIREQEEQIIELQSQLKESQQKIKQAMQKQEQLGRKVKVATTVAVTLLLIALMELLIMLR